MERSPKFEMGTELCIEACGIEPGHVSTSYTCF
jgi:hypothetical protein